LKIKDALCAKLLEKEKVMIDATVAISMMLFVVYIILSTILNDDVKKQKQSEDKTSQSPTDKKRREWQAKIARFKHLLTGSSWREPEGKKDFVGALFDDEVPDYLWYALNNKKISPRDFSKICDIFWGEECPRFGDFEFHQSLNRQVGTGLRIRNPKNFSAEITIDGHKCPLYQIGYSMFGRIEEGCVSFFNLYDKNLSPKTKNYGC